MGEGRGLEALGIAAGSLVGRSIFDVYRDSPQIVAHARAALRGEAFTTLVHLGASGLQYETRYRANQTEDLLLPTVSWRGAKDASRLCCRARAAT